MVYGYGGDTVVMDEWAGCELPVVEVIEEVEDCGDPFFQDMEHKAAAAEPAPAPVAQEELPVVIDTTPVQAQEKALPKPLVFEAPIDVEIAEPKAEVIPEPTAKEVIQKTVPTPAPKEILKEKIQEPAVVPVVVEPLAPVKNEATEINIQEEIAVVDIEDAAKPSPSGIHSVEKAKEHYVPSVLKAIETNDSPTNDLGTHDSAASALVTAPQTLTVWVVFDNHLREIILVSFLIFILISLLFI